MASRGVYTSRLVSATAMTWASRSERDFMDVSLVLAFLLISLPFATNGIKGEVPIFFLATEQERVTEKGRRNQKKTEDEEEDLRSSTFIVELGTVLIFSGSLYRRCLVWWFIVY
ncbi:unnamed protein product [Cochlearia groenlandica]